MERLRKNITFNHERILFLYGEKTLDRFLTPDYRELSITEALWEMLKEEGFECILFYSHTNRIFFMDEESRRHCRLPEPNNTASSSEVNKPIRFKGPLGHKRSSLLQSNQISHAPNTESRENDVGVHQISDASALSLIDWLMKNESIKSAIIIDQAETSLHHFSMLGAQAGRMGQWATLPSSNHNICILIFPCENLRSAFEEHPQYIPIPEFKTQFLNSIERRHHHNILKIPNPDKEEVLRWIHNTRIRNLKPISWEKIDRIAEVVSSDGKTASYWSKIFQEVKVINFPLINRVLESARDDFDIPWEEKLNSLIGLVPVKTFIKSRQVLIADRIERQRLGMVSKDEEPLSLHLAFLGNPGTGKTTVANLVGEMYRDLGVLRKGHVVKAEYKQLTSEHVGGSAKRTQEFIEKAYDGVLFIDEAYQLTSSAFGKEVIETLMTALENERSRFALVVAGYTRPMQDFFESNPGLVSRIPEEQHITFPDFDPVELVKIFYIFLKKKGLTTTKDFDEAISQIIENMHRERDVEHFGNARRMRELATAVEATRALRIEREGLKIDAKVCVDDLPENARAFLSPPIPQEEVLMKDLGKMIGLQEIKKAVNDLVLKLKTEEHRRKRGQKVKPQNLNMIFSGNPGTGKTTVAKLMGKILKGVGKLRKGHVVEVRASDLIAGYVGQTAEKTSEKIKEAIDGVLFIDEAYELADSGRETGSYKKEAVGVLMNFMDQYPERLIVIAAGYPKNMQDFLATNNGLTRRFGRTFIFSDYSNDELLEILKSKCAEMRIDFPKACESRAMAYFKRERDDSSEKGIPFVNVGIVDGLIEIMTKNQNIRYNRTNDVSTLDAFVVEDIPGSTNLRDEIIQNTHRYHHYNLAQYLQGEHKPTSDEIRSAVGLIETEKASEQTTGTGFIVSENGHIITAFHVVDGAEEIYITLNNQQEKHPAKIVGLDEKWDIAVLRLPDSQTYPWIPIAPKGDTLDLEQEISVLSFPLGTEYGREITITSGTISSLRQNNHLIQTSAPVTHGSSGGPVIDKNNLYAIGFVSGGNEDYPSAMIHIAVRTELLYQRFSEHPDVD
jgi:SpoVK/Ycf46/Vps4 family AAA+-type ATPase